MVLTHGGADGRINWFLPGSEETWKFPKRSDVPPAAVKVILQATRADGLKVIDIDTGRAMELKRAEEGWAFRDTVGPAWYKIYAVVKPGQAVRLPPPQRHPPAHRRPPLRPGQRPSRQRHRSLTTPQTSSPPAAAGGYGP